MTVAWMNENKKNHCLTVAQNCCILTDQYNKIIVYNARAFDDSSGNWD